MRITNLIIMIKKQHKDRNFISPVWLLVLMIVFVVNHIEYHYRSRAIAEKSSRTRAVVVKPEDGQANHATIGVDESFLSNDGPHLFLRFATLGTWDFDAGKPSGCPEPIERLNGKTVECVGFMYPLQAGRFIKHFALLRTTQTCCYGPRPQYNQYLFVEMRTPVVFERLRPVVVEGTFFADPNPDEGYIYRLEAVSATVIEDEITTENGAEAAQKARLALFDFDLLETIGKTIAVDPAGTIAIPSALSERHNQRVVVEGFLVGRTDDTPPGQVVGKYWWDGVMQGTPPGLYNAVIVYPRDESHVPPAWKQKIVFTGILKVTGDKAFYASKGIVSIADAIRGVPNSTRPGRIYDTGPVLTLWNEIVLFGLLFAIVFRKSRFFKKGVSKGETI